MALDLREASFERRGFATSDESTRLRLEGIGRTFILGYNAALNTEGFVSLSRTLDRTPEADRGFAFEGAAMALTLLDLITPWRRHRLKDFLDGPAREHLYLATVGAGWALARLRQGQHRILRGLDPLLHWLAFDGYGFHEAYFRPETTFQAHARPRALDGYALRVFDQGVGRGLWFASGANIERIDRCVAGFPTERRADLWSGLGLAAAYAGGADAVQLSLLRARAGDYNRDLAQGAAFAAKARERAASPAAHTDLACRIFCNCGAMIAAKATDDALEGLRGTPDTPDYEIWRRRIRDRISSEAGVP